MSPRGAAVLCVLLAAPRAAAQPAPEAPPEATPEAEPERPLAPAPPTERPEVDATPEPPSPIQPDSAEARGLQAFQRGDWTTAARELGRARAEAPAELELTLLLGICEHQLGHPRRAEPLLRAAARADDPQTRASARVFLALIAQAEGAVDAARAELRDVARSGDAALADSGRLLLGAVTPRRLQLVVLIRPEVDSNVPLLPGTTLAQGKDGQRADGDVLLLAALSVRPVRRLGLYLDETASYRQQFTLLDYSFFLNNVGARYAYLGRDDRAALGYGFETMTLGRAFFGLGHVVDASYRRRLWAELGLGLRYGFRHRSYAAAGYDAFTGPSHTASLELGWGTPERPIEVVIGYLVVREDTEDPVYTATGHGGRLHARFRLGRRVDLGLEGWAIYRGFDVENPDLGPRRDVQLYGAASVGVDLTRHVGLLVGATVLRNLSTVEDFDYLKLTANVGVAFGYAGPR